MESRAVGLLVDKIFALGVSTHKPRKRGKGDRLTDLAVAVLLQKEVVGMYPVYECVWHPWLAFPSLVQIIAQCYYST